MDILNGLDQEIKNKLSNSGSKTFSEDNPLKIYPL